MFDLSSDTAADLSLRLVRRGSHCSENLRKLIKAEKVEQVRPDSGNAISFALKP